MKTKPIVGQCLNKAMLCGNYRSGLSKENILSPPPSKKPHKTGILRTVGSLCVCVSAHLRGSVCARLMAFVCVSCVSIPAYWASCPLRKRREMKEKEREEKGGGRQIDAADSRKNK